MNLALSNLELFETTKAQRQDFVSQVISNIGDGNANPLKVHLQVKCLEDLIKQLTSSTEYRNFLLDEASKYGKSFEFQNAKFETKEMGVKYDYSQCNDPIHASLEIQIEELTESLKNREKFLKSLSLEGQDILIDDEVIRVYPPSKSSTTTISVNFK